MKVVNSEKVINSFLHTELSVSPAYGWRMTTSGTEAGEMTEESQFLTQKSATGALLQSFVTFHSKPSFRKIGTNPGGTLC